MNILLGIITVVACWALTIVGFRLMDSAPQRAGAWCGLVMFLSGIALNIYLVAKGWEALRC